MKKHVKGALSMMLVGTITFTIVNNISSKNVSKEIDSNHIKFIAKENRSKERLITPIHLHNELKKIEIAVAKTPPIQEKVVHQNIEKTPVPFKKEVVLSIKKPKTVKNESVINESKKEKTTVIRTVTHISKLQPVENKTTPSVPNVITKKDKVNHGMEVSQKYKEKNKINNKKIKR
jgi:hypothetical protein